MIVSLRERGSSPLAWLDEYKLTYSPSPPSSFALSLAEVWRESVREDSEGRQTATEPIEPAREPLGPPPLPSRMVALVKATWSKLCDWWKEGKQERKKE